MFGWTILDALTGGDAAELLGMEAVVDAPEDDSEAIDSVMDLTVTQRASPAGLRGTTTGA